LKGVKEEIKQLELKREGGEIDPESSSDGSDSDPSDDELGVSPSGQIC